MAIERNRHKSRVQTEEERHLDEYEQDPANQRLFRLSELDEFEVADYDPDVRGWSIYGADGKQLGTIHELVADKEAMEVRYLDVELTEDIEVERADRHVLIPIGLATVDEDEDSVFLFNVQPDMLQNCPRYRGGMISREQERTIRQCLSAEQTLPDDEQSDFYAHESFDQERFYGARRRRTPPSTADNRDLNKSPLA